MFKKKGLAATQSVVDLVSDKLFSWHHMNDPLTIVILLPIKFWIWLPTYDEEILFTVNVPNTWILI